MTVALARFSSCCGVCELHAAIIAITAALPSGIRIQLLCLRFLMSPSTQQEWKVPKNCSAQMPGTARKRVRSLRNPNRPTGV
jgi:hypothetical protein